ncbi:hypothetical protein, partial [Thiolapillus sp.]|uniref:hypothetical protein n=1 Tax=Thiolapillus sp. TaxID=2017437 RepID=UPI003AF81C5D
RSEAYFVFPLAQGTPGKQCGLAATGVYQPSLRSPWLAADVSNGQTAGPCSRAMAQYYFQVTIGCRIYASVLADAVVVQRDIAPPR